MMVFWVVAALLVLAALFFLLPPLLLKRQDKDFLDRDELNVTIFKDQLAELERDLAAAVLTQEQYDTARHDLERNFVQDTGDDDAHPVSSTDRVVGRATAVVIALVVPVLAVSLYNLLGVGEAGLNPQQAQQAGQQVVQGDESQETLQDAVLKLENRLESNPEDTESWVMLARTHYFLKQYAEAGETFSRASSLLDDADSNVLADYADALAMANERSMQGRPYQLLKKALQIQPFHEKSLWLAGVAAYQAEDLKSTLDYWERLLMVIPSDSEEHQQMLENVNEIRVSLGVPVEPADQVQAQGATVTQASISGVVRLDASLAAQASPTDTVFIFARAASGPRMPLAILRKQVKDLPLEFTLDDSMAMRPSMKLSSFEQVVVGARISSSGNAMPQSGDLQVNTEAMAVSGAGAVELVINSVVP